MKKKKTKSLPSVQRSIPEYKLDQAKTLYMDYVPVTKIAKQLDIPRTSLNHYIYTYWKPERDIAASDFVSDVAKARIEQLSGIQQSSLKVMRRCLDAITHRAEPPTTKEAVDAMKILEKMDILAKGNPDDYGYKPEDDALELEIVDPFAKEPLNDKEDD